MRYSMPISSYFDYCSFVFITLHSTNFSMRMSVTKWLFFVFIVHAHFCCCPPLLFPFQSSFVSNFTFYLLFSPVLYSFHFMVLNMCDRFFWLIYDRQQPFLFDSVCCICVCVCVWFYFSNSKMWFDFSYYTHTYMRDVIKLWLYVYRRCMILCASALKWQRVMVTIVD